MFVSESTLNSYATASFAESLHFNFVFNFVFIPAKLLMKQNLSVTGKNVVCALDFEFPGEFVSFYGIENGIS